MGLFFWYVLCLVDFCGLIYFDVFVVALVLLVC